MTTLTLRLKRLALTIVFALSILAGVHLALTSSASPARAWLARDSAGLPPLEPSKPVTEPVTYTLYLPVINRNYPIMQEVRALWVTRFEWTFYHRAVTTTDIDTIVDHAAAAHFNMLLFQIRGTADAFYSSTLEPWAARLTGETTATLGVDPGWDPLAYMVTKAHSSGLQVHAYMNVFPTWLCGVGAPPHTTPEHLFWTLSHSSTTWSAWRVYSDPQTPMNIDTCSDYLWATPALSLTRDHIAAVATDIVSRYNVDGIHLDLIRYPGSNYSYDPYTLQAFTDALQITPSLTITGWRPDFQRAQINTLVGQVYSAITSLKPDLWLSAAVWPNYTSSYNSYYQDSKGWLANNLIDANMPMLYSSDIVNDLAAWFDRAQGFINDSYNRYVIPGIGLRYTIASQTFCVPFDGIRSRIDAARAMGASGVALFSYSGLDMCNYWNDLANGPFATPAMVPKPSWKP
jgi:uncharacterized lipoprotein YddW (UPF0748 family)